MTELVLDNVRCNITLGSLLDKFSNLRRLSVVNAGLLSLEGFPSLPNLDEVALKYSWIRCRPNFNSISFVAPTWR